MRRTPIIAAAIGSLSVASSLFAGFTVTATAPVSVCLSMKPSGGVESLPPTNASGGGCGVPVGRPPKRCI